MGEWKKVKIVDLASRITSGGTPLTKHLEYYGGNIPWLNTKEIKNCRIFETEKYITELGLNNSSAKLIDLNSVIVAMYGATAGKIAINKIPLTTNQACCNITIDDKKADYNFIYYLLLSSFARLDSLTSGAAQQNLNVGLISNLEILVPELKEQKVIAEVLSSLDDKIDLLHRQNKTLEEMAQTLFRQWFIEEAKDEWEECKLGDVLEIKYGKDHKKLNDGNIPLYGSGGIMRYVDSFLYDQESILIPRKGTLTNLFYLNEPFWTVDTLFWSKVNTEKVSGKFLFFFLKTMDLSNLNVGSAVPSLTTKVLNEIKFLLPSLDEQKQFNEYADSAWEKMAKNKEQIKTLENMRDTLLPKLMSGEVRVKYD